MSVNLGPDDYCMYIKQQQQHQ